MKNRCLVCLTLIFCLVFPVFGAFIPVKSIEEDYADYLVLIGALERPTMGYRTLSDNVYTILDPSKSIWTAKEDSPWQFYGPDFFTSYNSAYPYGQNDGALWQGKGFNAQLKGGASYHQYGLTVVLKPELDFSQNLAFDLMKSANSYSSYAYYWSNLDLPQRFGDKPFFTFDWGDSEVRYSYKTLTIGAGTQALWIGPAYLNSIIHSNNAPTYPKIDFGFRKTKCVLPWLGWDIGYMELRFWTGFLGYSDYYKDGYSDKRFMISGMAFSYAPSFVDGLTFGFDTTFTDTMEWASVPNMLPFIPQLDGNKTEDGEMVLSADWLFPKVGFEVYGEIGVDDYVCGNWFTGSLRYPFHTMVYNVGMKKSIGKGSFHGELIFEWSNMEMSQDSQTQWAYMFYSHGEYSHTNKGQLLGAGSGYSGSSQYLALKAFHPKGVCTLFIQRENPDNDYIYAQMVGQGATTVENQGTSSTEYQYFSSFKANFVIGLESSYFVGNHCIVTGGVVYDLVINARYKQDGNGTVTLDEGVNTYLHNLRVEMGFAYKF